MPEFQHAFPPPGGANLLPGSPHFSAMVVWVMLLVLARSRYRTRPLNHEKLVVWAFAIGLARDLLFLLIPTIQRAFPSGGHPMPLFPVIETWMAQVSAVMLVGAFLQYVSKRDDVGRQYLKFALSAITVALLIAAVTSGPAPATHIEGFRPPRGPMVPIILIGAGIAVMVWGFGLSMKLTKGAQRTAMLIGIAVFSSREVWKVMSTLGGAAGAGRPDLTFITVATQFGAMCFGYIYMREYSEEIRADFEALEGRVQERTA